MTSALDASNASTSSSRRSRSPPFAIRRAAGVFRTRDARSTSAVSAGRVDDGRTPLLSHGCETILMVEKKLAERQRGAYAPRHSVVISSIPSRAPRVGGEIYVPLGRRLESEISVPPVGARRRLARLRKPGTSQDAGRRLPRVRPAKGGDPDRGTRNDGRR